MVTRRVGRVTAIGAIACTLMAPHCPGFLQTSTSSTSTTSSAASEKKLPHLGGGGAKGQTGGLLGRMRTGHEETPDLETGRNHVTAPSFHWTNKSPGISAKRRG
jgi:hypothetical protein